MTLLGVVSLGTRNDQLEFGDDLHSGLAPGISLLLRLFAKCKIALFYYCLLDVITVMLTILVLGLISILHSSLTLQTKTYSLSEV